MAVAQSGIRGSFIMMMKYNLSIPFRFVKYSSCALLLGMPFFLRADDWPNFRGPNRDGISRETAWKASSSAVLVWKAQVGLGYGMPVVGGGKVIVSGHDGADTDSLFCFDEASGKEKWKFTYPQPLGDKFFQGGTTGTATLDGSRVFSLAREGELFCLDSETGKVVWKVHLQKDLGYKKPTWGFTGAPLVRGDRLYITAGDSGLALNKADGKAIWKSKNEEAGYSTPYLFSPPSIP